MALGPEVGSVLSWDPVLAVRPAPASLRLQHMSGPLTPSALSKATIRRRSTTATTRQSPFPSPSRLPAMRCTSWATARSQPLCALVAPACLSPPHERGAKPPARLSRHWRHPQLPQHRACQTCLARVQGVIWRAVCKRRRGRAISANSAIRSRTDPTSSDPLVPPSATCTRPSLPHPQSHCR